MKENGAAAQDSFILFFSIIKFLNAFANLSIFNQKLEIFDEIDEFKESGREKSQFLSQFVKSNEKRKLNFSWNTSNFIFLSLLIPSLTHLFLKNQNKDIYFIFWIRWDWDDYYNSN